MTIAMLPRLTATARPIDYTAHDAINEPSRQRICLSLDRIAGSTLNAAGNIFSGPTDCSSSTATLTKNGSCSGAVDYSVRTTGTTTHAIVVSQCH
jgi:hypothetical protein